MTDFRILAINPGSTSTKVAVSHGMKIIYEKNLTHSESELRPFKTIIEQYTFRKNVIEKFLEKTMISLESLDCVVGRGGFLRPIMGGTYFVNDEMCHDLKNSPKDHASNLGALIAKEFSDKLGIPAYIVDPIVVDEMDEIARISGLCGVERKSIFHALNQKSVARKTAEKYHRQYSDLNMIVAHMGGGITVGVHQKGRIIDVNNGLDGEGPFSPERAGGLPVESVIEMCFMDGISKKEVYQKIKGTGGLLSYLGVNDVRIVEEKIKQGDDYALLIFQAMAYQVAKEISSCAAVLKGDVDVIVFTGGIAYSKLFVDLVAERIGFIAPVEVSPGEKELEALIAGAYRVLDGFEEPLEYTFKCKNRMEVLPWCEENIG